MAKQDYTRNEYSPIKWGDVSIIPIRIVSGATPREPTCSGPETTVTDATGGVYTFTFPGGVLAMVMGATLINGSAIGDDAQITALNATAGTGTVRVNNTGPAALGAGQEIHLFIRVGAP